MQKGKWLFTVMTTFCSCMSGTDSGNTTDISGIETYTNGTNVKERIPAPDGYSWVKEQTGSFAEFLQQVPLKSPASKILDFTNTPISNQREHVAILDYDVGNKDLQQCADEVIRLRAEYLFATKRFDEIGFHFTSGHYFRWNDYKEGIRPIVNNNSVSFAAQAEYDDTYKSFRKYLDVIYTYAGTISLAKETKPVSNSGELKAGDMLIKPGSPGHVVIIIGRAKNQRGNSVYLIGQGYTPAQSIHIITNPANGNINPWYELSFESAGTQTARYSFDINNFRMFE